MNFFTNEQPNKMQIYRMINEELNFIISFHFISCFFFVFVFYGKLTRIILTRNYLSEVISCQSFQLPDMLQQSDWRLLSVSNCCTS